MELEIRCLNEVGLARARVNLDRFSEKRLVKNIILTEVSIWHSPIFCKLATVGKKVKTQTVRSVEREGSYIAYYIRMASSCKSREIYMATWQCPSGVGWCAGNGEGKRETIRHKAKTDTIFETLWINSWPKTGKTYTIARHSSQMI